MELPPPSPSKSKSRSVGNVQKKKKLAFGETTLGVVDLEQINQENPSSFINKLLDDKNFNVEDIISLLEENKQLIKDDSFKFLLTEVIKDQIADGLITFSQLLKYDAVILFIDKGIKPKPFLKPTKFPTKRITKK
jgi:hypothetical protein